MAFNLRTSLVSLCWDSKPVILQFVSQRKEYMINSGNKLRTLKKSKTSLYVQIAGRMNNMTTFDGLLFVLNNTNVQNGTLQSPIPVLTIISVTVCSIGILSNLLVILVIMLSSLRNSVFMNLIMSLAIFDSMHLLSVINFQRGIFGEILLKPSLLHCGFNIVFLYVSGFGSSWVTVFISFERYIAVFYPFKVHIYCTKKRMFTAVFALSILIGISAIPVFYSCSVIVIDQQPKCLYNGNSILTDVYFLFSMLIFYTVLPLIFITVLNVLLIRQIQAQKAFRAKSQVHNFRPASFANNSSLIAIMVSVCVFFAVASLPAAIMSIVNWLCKLTTASHCIPIEGGLYIFTVTLDNINHSINFFLYCLTGSVFRHALFQLFECKNSKHSGGHLPEQGSIEQNAVSNVRNYSNSRV